MRKHIFVLMLILLSLNLFNGFGPSLPSLIGIKPIICISQTINPQTELIKDFDFNLQNFTFTDYRIKNIEKRRIFPNIIIIIIHEQNFIARSENKLLTIDGQFITCPCLEIYEHLPYVEVYSLNGINKAIQLIKNVSDINKITEFAYNNDLYVYIKSNIILINKNFDNTDLFYKYLDTPLANVVIDLRIKFYSIIYSHKIFNLVIKS